MPYTPAPTAPARNRPATFADEGDAFIAWMGPFNDYLEEVRLTSVEAIAVSASDIALASAYYKGPWSSLVGALNMPASVSHNGAFWLLAANVADVTAVVPGVSASWSRIKVLPDAYDYTARASLRALIPATGDFAAVRGLGLFSWVYGSTRLDDDETAFAAAGGMWLLVAADPDYVHAVQEILLDDIEDMSADITAAQADITAAQGDIATAQGDIAAAQGAVDALSAKFLRGTFSMSLTSLAAITSSAFTCTVTGAAVGDSVLVNPGNAFGTSTADQGKLSYVAYVSAANTVSITVRNASASTASMTASTWSVLVIKQ